jgi:alginate O-acetyltransferase complex protein AlgI
VLKSLFGGYGLTLSPFLVSRLPFHLGFLHAGQVIPIVGEGRPLALPQCIFFILAAGFGAVAMPHVHRMSPKTQLIALTLSFGLTIQALFFAPNVAPFLYFRF